MRSSTQCPESTLPALVALGILIGCLSAGDDTSPPDADGDGLSDTLEAEYGTDPDEPDTDGDGFLDGVEVDEGTNPLYAYSHPYQGGYYVGWCDTPPQPTGPTGADEGGLSAYQVVDVVENFDWRDQNGEYVSLYSFCGHLTVIQFSSFC